MDKGDVAVLIVLAAEGFVTEGTLEGALFRVYHFVIAQMGQAAELLLADGTVKRRLVWIVVGLARRISARLLGRLHFVDQLDMAFHVIFASEATITHFADKGLLIRVDDLVVLHL